MLLRTTRSSNPESLKSFDVGSGGVEYTVVKEMCLVYVRNLAVQNVSNL